MSKCICDPPTMRIDCPTHGWIAEELRRRATTPSMTDIVQQEFKKKDLKKLKKELDKHPNELFARVPNRKMRRKKGKHRK